MLGYLVPEFNLNHVFDYIHKEILVGAKELEEVFIKVENIKKNTPSNASFMNSKVFSEKIKRKTMYPNMTDYMKTNTLFPEKPHTSNDLLYYNYVLGYLDNGRLILRVGLFDNCEENYTKELKQYTDFILNNLTTKGQYRTVSYETYYGLKHVQLAGNDLKVLFSGILQLNKDGIIISPMSGTWLENMQQLLVEECEKIDLLNALNVLNIMCTMCCLRFAYSDNTIISTNIVKPPRWLSTIPLDTKCLEHYLSIKKHRGCELDIPGMTCLAKHIEAFREALAPPTKKCARK